jgi:RNA polymerase sigma-70 factor (ECF subfamily)
MDRPSSSPRFIAALRAGGQAFLGVATPAEAAPVVVRWLARGLRMFLMAPPAWTTPAGRPLPPRRPAYDEPALIEAARRGHLPAFNQLVLHYQSLAYNIAYRIMGDADASADATQDGFLKAYQRLHQYRGGSFKAWLLRIITNTCYDALRARQRRPTVSLEPETDDDTDAEHDGRLLDPAERPDAYVLRQEMAAVIHAAILKLPPDQRLTLVLSDIEGLDYNEIAEATGAALGTVKSRLSRARARVRDLLLAQGELLPAQYRLAE